MSKKWIDRRTLGPTGPDDMRRRHANGKARTNATSSKDRRKKVAALIRRDGDHCHWCDGPFHMEDGPNHPQARQLGHLIPRRKGGTEALDNLVLAHRDCDNRRSNPPIGRRRTAEDS